MPRLNAEQQDTLVEMLLAAVNFNQLENTTFTAARAIAFTPNSFLQTKRLGSL